MPSRQEKTVRNITAAYPTTTKERMVVVVTGVSRGLGKALSFEFASRGHIVAGCSRFEEKLKLLEAGLGAGHYLQQCDVAHDDQVKSFAQNVIEKVGVPDILINSAGQINTKAKLWEVPAEDFNYIIDVNVKGPVNMIRHFLPAMIARGTGMVVNFSSSWGRSAAADFSPYVASKWALEGLTKTLAKEIPVGFVTVALNPGVINTDMIRTCFGADAENHISPEAWAPHCVDLILKLTHLDNGSSVSVVS